MCPGVRCRRSTVVLRGWSCLEEVEKQDRALHMVGVLYQLFDYRSYTNLRISLGFRSVRRDLNILEH